MCCDEQAPVRIATRWTAARLALRAGAAVCLLCACAPAAGAAVNGKLRKLDSSLSGVTTDGSRYAAYVPKTGHVRINDTSKHSTLDWPVDPTCVYAYEGSSAGDALLACRATHGFRYSVLA